MPDKQPYSDPQREELTERLEALNRSIEQRESRINELSHQLTAWQDSQPEPVVLTRTVVSLMLSLAMCVCTFYLIDEALKPVFPNRLIGLGVFLAGMFNLFSQTSFLAEGDSRFSVRRIVAEVGMPVAAAGFILIQALQTQTVSRAIAVSIFSFFLFLLGGRWFMTLLTNLQTELDKGEANRERIQIRTQHLPSWVTEIDRLNHELEAIRLQRRHVITARNQTDVAIARLNTKRDELVNLFVGEFELARSLRDRLTDKQRKVIMNFD